MPFIQSAGSYCQHSRCSLLDTVAVQTKLTVSSYHVSDSAVGILYELIFILRGRNNFTNDELKQRGKVISNLLRVTQQKVAEPVTNVSTEQNTTLTLKELTTPV